MVVFTALKNVGDVRMHSSIAAQVNLVYAVGSLLI